MPLRPAAGGLLRRARPGLRLPLPRLSEAVRQCVFRTGALARGQVTLHGQAKTWERVADSRGLVTYRFCGECGSRVAYTNDGWPGLVAVPLGAFADPAFPAPKHSVYEHRQHGWVAILGDEVEHSASPSTSRAPGHRTEPPA